MIYRPPERVGGVRRGASNRDVALLLVAMAFLTALLFSYAGAPGQPRFDTAPTADARHAINTPLAPFRGQLGLGGGPATATEPPSLATLPAEPSFGGPVPGFPAPTAAFVAPSPFSPPPSLLPTSTLPDAFPVERPASPTAQVAPPFETVASKPTMTPGYPGP